MILKPMRGVAPKNPLTDFPYLASVKIDGVRAVVKDGVVYSKTLTPIPNHQVQALFGHLHGADGELTVGPAHCIASDGPEGVFGRSRGPIMSKNCDADFQFWIFDRWDRPDLWAAERCLYKSGLPKAWMGRGGPHTNLIVQSPVRDQPEVDAVLERYLREGYEGAMLRQVNAPYKYGQSTEKEGYLLKLKPFEDAEAVILDVIEQLENTNAATKDALGHSKRSSAKAGKIGKGTFGAFLVRDLKTGAEFTVGNGPGLTRAVRDDWWENRKDMPGKYITYKFQEIGTKNKPRLPQILRFRDPIDMVDL